jgi:hypothetical protein
MLYPHHIQMTAFPVSDLSPYALKHIFLVVVESCEKEPLFLTSGLEM